MGDKVRVRKGKPRPPKVPKYMLSGKDVALPRQQDVGLEAPSFKECVIAH